MVTLAEYIWLDGTEPTQELRSKSRVVRFTSPPKNPDEFPEWSFDGSSTNQADGNKSDLLLKPVNFINDPIRGEGHFLVLCEVFESTGHPHQTNHRATLRHILDNGGSEHAPFAGFEQEYTFFQGEKPLGWPEEGVPAPQGPYYCGIGTDKVYGREIVEEHTQACIDAGILMYGTNAEVMPAQWEFQIGYRGFEGDHNDILSTCDDLWFGRWLLHRIAEEFDVTVSYENKPVKGDWNGAGCHTNFSTAEMRQPEKGMDAINAAIKNLSEKHEEHINVYGANLDERLTGDHETCSIHEFRSGVSDRGSSIRIPLGVNQKGYGYLEDRRPGANIDPYLVVGRLITTICDNVSESLFKA